LKTLILDSGAFIVAERSRARVAALLRAALDEGSTILTTASVIAEIWRAPPLHATAALIKLLDSVDPMNESRAKEIGTLLGRSKSVQIVDAHVATLAIRTQPSLIVTSDPTDYETLLASMAVHFDHVEKRDRKASVTIAAI